MTKLCGKHLQVLRAAALAVLFACAFFPISAHAACSNPTGNEGEVIYNSAYNVPQYCDGSDNWIAMTGSLSDLGQGLVSHWKLDETSGTTAVDSVGVNNGTMGGGLDAASHSTAGKIGTALNFTPNHTINLGDYDMNSSFSISIWFNADVMDSNWRSIIMRQNNYGIEHRFNNIYFRVGDSWGNSVSTGGLTTGTWYHAVLTYDGDTDTITGYLNGSSLGTNTSAFTNSDNDTAIGSWGNFQEYFDGAIDEVRFYNRVLTSAEVLELYSSEATQIVPSGLVGHWRFDEGYGITAVDSSGNGNDATLAGDYAWDGDGIVGGNIDFAGANGRAEVTQDPSINDLAQITFSAWVKGVSGGGARLVTKGDDFTIFGTPTDDWLEFQAMWDGSNGEWRSPDNILEDEAWHHFAVTYDFGATSNDPKMYVDGVEIDNGSFDRDVNPTGSPVASTENLIIGNNTTYTNDWSNDIDDVRFYNRILSADEIMEIYKARDGIRYNDTSNVAEYFDGNAWQPMVQHYEVDEGPVYSDGADGSCPNIGDLCSDGSLFAGDTNLFVTDINQSAATPWYYDMSHNGVNTINPDSTTDGAANEANLTVPLNQVPAIEMCSNLSRHGHDDWYLPATDELNQLCTNKAAIDANAGESFTSVNYWTSSEDGSNDALRRWFADCSEIPDGNKNFDADIRCVRRGLSTIAGTGGLVGHWKLDEITFVSAADSSGNGNHGSLVNGLDPTIDSTVGAVGRALDFTGDSVRVQVPYDASLVPSSNSFSFAFWMNSSVDWDDIPDNEWRLFDMKDGASNDSPGYHAFVNGYVGEALGVYIGDGSSNRFFGSGGLDWDTNRWYHVAFTYDGATVTGTWYRDSVIARVDTPGAPFTPDWGTADLIFGDGLYNGDLEGVMDDVRLYNRTLTATEIAALYNMGAPVGANTALPQGCPNPDDICDDGSRYIGTSPDGSLPMYAIPVPATNLAWNDNLTDFTTTSVTNADTGAANTLSLTNIDANNVSAGFQTHQAAQYCYDLVAHGASDWYLPAENELDVFDSAGGLLGGLVPGAWYWTSTELNNNLARSRDFTNSFFSNRSKQISVSVVCTRKGPAPRCANPYGLEGAMIYNTTHDVVQFCDGARWRAVGKVQ